ncbi:MAG: diguanylate cyclase/phosphodiesterase with domain containing protein [Firmicutes bacterium]|nr:diguanylate cyclase/phosphodiesterase with domain containing protein [Bacillota bacterium]
MGDVIRLNIDDMMNKKIIESNNTYSQEEQETYNELEIILKSKDIKAIFQPIVSLVDGEVFGYEALSRGPKGSLLERPDVLFPAAEQFNKVWELEFLCRSKAFARANGLPKDKMLFVNVDPKIINDPRFQKGVTLDMLAHYQIDASNIIFEITEKNSIEDYKSFRKVLDNYTSQGYKIAIDDTGSGYSGLKLLAETRPQFIKIDMDLVRNIDKDAFKKGLMKAFYEFSVVANMKMIAEGIETFDELNTLINIGIPYGQGYLLQRPAAQFLDISPGVKDAIISKNHRKKQEAFQTALTMPIGEIGRRDQGFSAVVTGGQVLDHFNDNPNVMGITILQGDTPVGLLMKNKFLTHLATKYGVAVYMNRPAGLLMDQNFLVVDYNTPLEQVSKLAVARGEDSLYDYIVITKSNKYYGITTVKQLLEKTTDLEIKWAKHSNPLSGLPGNILIEEKLKLVIDAGQPYSVLYFDLDNFKAYNDAYGFDNGDKVLCMTAQIIQDQFKDSNMLDVFIGHIGGDDFIAVVRDIDVISVCQTIIDYFDVRIRGFYAEEDIKRGYIVAKNRHGVEENFPVVSLSIAVLTSIGQIFKNPADLAEAASVVKKKCKLIWESCYCIE